MKIDLTPTEVALLLHFLDDYGDHLSNAGCNDIAVRDSPEIREMITLMSDEPQEFKPRPIQNEEGELIACVDTMDFKLLAYLKSRLNFAWGEDDLSEVVIQR